MSDTWGAAIHHFQFRVLWLGMGWILIVLVLYLSLVSSPPNTLDIAYADKLNHLFAYSALMGWFTQLYDSRRHSLVLAIGFCLMGVFLEFLQGMGGHRFFEYTDMVANFTGVFLGWWLSRNWCVGWLVRVDHALSRQ